MAEERYYTENDEEGAYVCWGSSGASKFYVFDGTGLSAPQVCKELNKADERARKEERAAIAEEQKVTEKPEPKIECAAGCEAWSVNRLGTSYLHVCDPKHKNVYHSMDCLPCVPRWTGRYGYHDKDGGVAWLLTPRGWRDPVTGQLWAGPSLIPQEKRALVLPSYVEMKTED